MIAKCANPDCKTSFRYFREGKLYFIDPREAGASRHGQAGNAHAEHFWLCGKCSLQMRLMVDSAGAVVLTTARFYSTRAA